MLWIRHLGLRDLPHLVTDLVVAAIWSIGHRDLERLRGEWASWKSTAEVYSSPEELAAMLEPIDGDEVTEVFPPTEEAAAADLELAQLLEERIAGRRAGRRGTPIEQVARELGFGHLLRDDKTHGAEPKPPSDDQDADHGQADRDAQ